MPDVVIVTDSNAGITKEESGRYGIEVLPMSFIINGKIYYEGKDISHEKFYEKLEAGADVATSQPAPGEVTALWDKLLKRHDEIVYIPMAEALSKSYETAIMLAKDYGGRVQVADSKRISVPQKMLVLDALQLAREGKSASEIRRLLNENALNSVVYIAVDTLKYLKKGGRITGAAAAIGSVLNIKPILMIKGKKLDAYEKARGMKAAKRMMLQAVHRELENEFKAFLDKDEICLQMAHSCPNDTITSEWEKQIREEFPNLKLCADSLPLCTVCHIGPGGLGIAVTRRLRRDW